MKEEKIKSMDLTHQLYDFSGVNRFRSIWRAIRRGKASYGGTIYPKRPFNNRKPTFGRAGNIERKAAYVRIKNLV